MKKGKRKQKGNGDMIMYNPNRVDTSQYTNAMDVVRKVRENQKKKKQSKKGRGI